MESSEASYHLLTNDDKAPLDKTNKHSCYRLERWQASNIIFWFIATIAICASIYTILIYRPDQTSSEWIDCGGSPEEARNRGCKFDLLSFAWQTPDCYDHDLLEEFLAYDEWEFFTDKLGNATTTVPLEVARRGERTLYATETYHFVHCTFMWLQMHRAYTVLGYIDSHLDAYNHTLHCQGVLFRRGNPPSRVTTVGVLKYPSCRRIY